MPQVPVIVGVGHITERPSAHLQDASDVIELSAKASSLAIENTSSPIANVKASIDSIYFVDIAGEYRLLQNGKFDAFPGYQNPSLSLKRKMGLDNAARLLKSNIGGSMPQTVINLAAAAILNGEAESCLVTGGETIESLMRAIRGGYTLSTNEPSNDSKKIFHYGDDIDQEPSKVGSDEPFINSQDFFHGLTDMTSCYAILEQATRRFDGVSREQRNEENSKIMSAYSRVAARDKEHSWFPTERSWQEIAATTESNRVVSGEYNKLQCAVMDVNMAASVLMMSEEKATELGIPKEKWVYLHGGADSSCVTRLLEKPDFHTCPAMRVVGREVFKDVPVDQVDFFEIYSCFPIAVRMICREMGIDKVLDVVHDAERLTQVGGLPYFGGPGNNFVTHGVVKTVETLRQNRGKYGLVVANGGVFSKISAGLYSTIRPENRINLYQNETKFTNKRETLLNPGKSVVGRITDFTISYPARDATPTIIAIGEVTSGDHVGRFVAKSDDNEAIREFTANPDSCYGLSVQVETVDVTGEGKRYVSSFTLLSPPSVSNL